MTELLWTHVDEYLEATLLPADPVLDAALRASAERGLPSIQVSPTQGKFLHLLARACRAERILEVGTLGGYSTIWLGRALPPGGRLISLELNPAHAEVARANLRRAGLAEIVDVRVGPAAESLERLAREEGAKFDLIFLDADKPNNALYLDFALRLGHSGTVLVIDNVVREGTILDHDSTDPNVVGTRRALGALGREPRLDATVLQTVGSKKHDGFALAVLR
jgi:predicted O-methyltransferase YrrM